MSGLSLRTAASYFRGDSFTGWNQNTGVFGDEFVGRLFVIDRFKSIYNRPTRRQKMTISSDIILPESYVVRREQDQEIFLVSHLVEKEFWKGSDNYDNVATLHRVKSIGSGSASFYSARTYGTDDDLGFVEVLEESSGFVDLELRSTSREDATLDVSIDDYVATYSNNFEPEPGDYFFIDGSYYRVENPYVDSGFKCARVTHEEPAYTECTYKLRNPPTVSYDPSTGVVDRGTQDDRDVSCLIGSSKEIRNTDTGAMGKELTVYIYERHIGFVPHVGDRVIIKETEYRIEDIEYSKLELQWKLKVSV